MNVARFLTATMLAILLVACRTTPPIDWDSRIGHYTYDQAVIDLGPPDKVARLTDGSTVAEWLTGRKTAPSFSVGTGVFGRSTGVSVGQTVGGAVSGKFLRLTFDQENRLRAWTKVTR